MDTIDMLVVAGLCFAAYWGYTTFVKPIQPAMHAITTPGYVLVQEAYEKIPTVGKQSGIQSINQAAKKAGFPDWAYKPGLELLFGIKTPWSV